MKQLLIATTNPGKLSEISQNLSGVPVTLLTLRDIPDVPSPDETGSTFEENAILKARYYVERFHIATLADDGGFEIDYLHGEPGVKSHRWIHRDREDTDEELIAHTFRMMEGVPKEKRGAQLRAVLALVLPDGHVYTATASTRGVVADKPAPIRCEGFPYRSVLFLPEVGKYYNHDVLTVAENDRYNHRKKCVLELIQHIVRWAKSESNANVKK